MKRLSILIIFFSITNFNVFGHVGHYKNYSYLEYELYRNNKSIGFHKYNFERNNDLLTVKSHVEFNIIKLGVNLYKYKAISEESYKNDRFFSFSSKTNQNAAPTALLIFLTKNDAKNTV